MNEVIKGIKERRSIRKYKAEMPKDEEIQAVIDAGLYAASAMGKQKVITVAVTNPELIAKLSAVNGKVGGFKEGVDPFYGAPVVLVVLSEKDWPLKQQDGSLVLGNMMLAAHSLGLGSCWIHRAKEEFEMDEFKQILADLGIEGEWEGIGHCILGYPDCEQPAAAPRAEGRVYYVK